MSDVAKCRMFWKVFQFKVEIKYVYRELYLYQIIDLTYCLLFKVILF